MKQNDKVRTYFDRHARQFDELYRQDGGLSTVWNRWVRQPFYRRFEMTIAACGNVEGKRILDVGCGSGRYSVALARRGARVTGIDFADNMIELANELARNQGVDSRCEFISGDFLQQDFDEPFDISLAIGFFDYIADPTPFLEKLHQLTRQMAILTFPKPGGWRAPQRWLRYRLQGCPLYFHSEEVMASAFEAAGFESWRFAGSWAVAFPPGSIVLGPTTKPGLVRANS